MVVAVQPRRRAAEVWGVGGQAAAHRALRAYGRWWLWAVQELWRRREESWRRRAAIVVQKYAHLVPPRSGGDHHA